MYVVVYYSQVKEAEQKENKDVKYGKNFKKFNGNESH